MKKNILLITTFLVISLTFIIGCNKGSENPINNSNQIEKEMIQDIGVGNYCYGCGNSNQKEYGCRYMGGYGGPVCNVLTDCSVNTINSGITSNSLPYSLINTNQVYGYRDGLLVNSVKGQKYITYYNLISQVMSDQNLLSLSNFAQHYSFALKTINACNTIVNGNNTDIPFNTSYKNDAIALLNYYQINSPNSHFTGVLSDITIDVTAVENMTKAQVINYMNI